MDNERRNKCKKILNKYLDELQNKAFFQPILPFTNGDYIHFSINLNRSDSFLEFGRFKWINHRWEPSQKLEKIIFDSNYNFHKNKDKALDLSRICEIEFTKKNWKDITDFRENTFNQYLNKFDFNTNEIILEHLENYKKILKPYFNLVQANADIDCFILLKLIFKAIAPGR